MNRFFTVFALAACALAEPEADPLLVQAVRPLVYGVDPHANAGLVHHTASGAVVPDKTNSVKIAEAQHLATKGLTYAYKAPAATVATFAPYTYAAAPAAYHYAPYTYAAPYTYNVPHVVAKREAEAEPEAEADPAVFYNAYYPYAHTAYSAGYYPYTAAKYVASAPVVKKVETTAVKPAVATYATAPYAAYATYPAYSAYAPYTYGYGFHSLHKREAEAEPEADADPAAFYRYAYGRYSPYTYGYYPYSTYRTAAYTYPRYGAYTYGAYRYY